MGNKIIIILFGVFVLGLVIFVVQSNFLGKIGAPFASLFNYKASSWFVPASSTLSAGGSATAFSAPKSQPVSVPSSSSSEPTNVNVQPQPSATTTIPASEIPKGFTLAELSPYFKKVTFGGASAGNFYSYGTISLLSYGLSASDTVDITGWQIKTNRGDEYIPQAINFYDPSGLSAASDIVIKQNQNVYIYSSSGPFNLRLNECIGYIGNSNKFTPSLPSNCPYIDQSAISKMGFTGACENYIYSLGSCQVPDLNDAQIAITDYACRDYLENNFNYRACVGAHASDTNFLSNQWWIWMGSSPLDQYHDTVNLFDNKGLLVDQYSY
jgi:hypothetical protein